MRQEGRLKGAAPRGAHLAEGLQHVLNEGSACCSRLPRPAQLGGARQLGGVLESRLGGAKPAGGARNHRRRAEAGLPVPGAGVHHAAPQLKAPRSPCPARHTAARTQQSAPAQQDGRQEGTQLRQQLAARRRVAASRAGQLRFQPLPLDAPARLRQRARAAGSWLRGSHAV